MRVIFDVGNLGSVELNSAEVSSPNQRAFRVLAFTAIGLLVLMALRG